MSTDNNNHGLEEQRRRKAENFKLNIRDNYDDDGTSYGSSEPEEISSYSGEEVKDQIARESKRSLKSVKGKKSASSRRVTSVTAEFSELHG